VTVPVNENGSFRVMHEIIGELEIVLQVEIGPIHCFDHQILHTNSLRMCRRVYKLNAHRQHPHDSSGIQSLTQHN